MSNYLAIATVTATLRYMLLKSLPPDLSGAAVTTLRPDAQLSVADATGINIFLYQVLPCATAICPRGVAMEHWFSAHALLLISTISLLFMAATPTWSRSGCSARPLPH